MEKELPFKTPEQLELEELVSELLEKSDREIMLVMGKILQRVRDENKRREL